METLFAGIIMLALALVLSLAVYKGSRRAAPSALMREAWVANLHAPLILALFAFGCGFLIKFGLTAVF